MDFLFFILNLYVNTNKNCWWRGRGKFLDIPLLDERLWSYFCQFWKAAVAAIKQTVCFITNFCKYSFCPLKNKRSVDPNAGVSLLQAGGSLKGQAFMWFVSLNTFRDINNCPFDEKTVHLKLTFVAREESVACSQPEVGVWQALYFLVQVPSFCAKCWGYSIDVSCFPSSSL